MSIHDGRHDIAVIGAGAAGLAAAIFAAEAAAKGDRPRRIVLFDGAKTIGAKILLSGGGRCNVTHDVVGRLTCTVPRNTSSTSAITRMRAGPMSGHWRGDFRTCL